MIFETLGKTLQDVGEILQFHESLMQFFPSQSQSFSLWKSAHKGRASQKTNTQNPTRPDHTFAVLRYIQHIDQKNDQRDRQSWIVDKLNKEKASLDRIGEP